MKFLILILAGGQSRRMGRDKAALPFGRGTLLTHLVETLRPLGPVAVSVRETGRYDTGGAPEIPDNFPGQGPLAGLEAALASPLHPETVFLTGTDLPFLSPALVQTLCARFSPEAQALVLRRQDGKLEPLCALYRRSCLEPLRLCLSQGQRSFQALFSRVQVQYIEEAQLPHFDLARELTNVNTWEEYERAKMDSEKL